MWAEDPTQPVVDGTRGLPMPVRVVFGTRNADVARKDGAPGVATGGTGENDWSALLADATKGAGLEVQDYLSSLGDVVPAQGGDTQTRFMFREGAGHAVRVEDPGEEVDFPLALVAPELRVLRGLPTDAHPDGPTNEDDVLGLAEQLADAVWARLETEEVGHLVVRFPRAQEPNGRVTAVQWTMAQGGAGIDTRVSFDHEVEPLPGLEHVLRKAQPLRTVFGLDPRDYT